MQKEFGKLSAQQIRDFYELFCEFLDNFLEDLDNQVKSRPLINSYPIWYSLYEQDLNLVIAYLLTLIGMDKEIHTGIDSGDPQQYLIELLRSGYEPPAKIENFDDQELINLFSCFLCLCANLFCFAAYRTDLHQLLKEAREGNKESLFMAVNIDQTISSSETASKLISKAFLENDGDFFDSLSKALKGGYPKKPADKYAELNFFMYIVEDAVDGQSINYDALHRLFTEDIPLYPDINKSKDSFGSFKKQLDRTRHKVKDMKT